MRSTILIACLLIAAAQATAQTPMRWMPYAQQSGLYHTSEHVTSSGVGIGLGVALRAGDHFVAQSDCNIHWLNGNAATTRLAAGYVRSGTWAPAILGNVSLLWGSRTEILLEDGRRPVSPVAVLGLRIAPLRFENDKGYVSALETGFGLGPYKGRCLEVSILVVGIRL
jgi:hypothetical protein